MTSSAQVIRTIELDQSIQPRAPITFHDAVKLVLPEQNPDGTIARTAHVRDGWGVNDATVYHGRMNLVTVDAAWLRSRELSGQKRLVLFIKLDGQSDNTLAWGELCLLAVFNTSPQITLTDLVDVGGNRVTSLIGTIDFHRREDGIVIGYELRKNDEEHQNYSFLAISGGRVADLFNGIPYSYYGHKDNQEISQSGNYRTQRVNGSNYRELAFEYDFTESRGGNRPIRPPKHFRLRARWRAGKYRWLDGGAQLKRMNAERNRVGSI